MGFLIRFASTALPILFLAGIAIGCHGFDASAPEPAAASLRTNATQYTVRHDGFLHRATIGYVYANGTGAAVSANYCHSPSPPLLEKQVGGRWVAAYHAIVQLCLSIPPFVIPAGANYDATLQFLAATPGNHFGPELLVDEVPGTYRLRWVLRAGNNPDDVRAPLVEAISNSFELVEQ